MHDVYDPPTMPEIDWEEPGREPLIVSRGDVVCLVSLCAALFVAGAFFWRSEPILALLAAGAGSLVVMESWLTALAFFHRSPPLGLKARWTVFLAAILPWIVGVAAAVGFLLALFWISDRFLPL
ncbi:hypothetical protein [Planctomyces sp. SH-PL62]|uniref:hypothetical protein n=1 Tax=Planctomyces sp. SH-PL62 TaxID=1636152 RepID=UPI00078B3A38|nr:hypothetical protein [Planctomyces sp. SH-PL62]AMV38085.1 hypothetical protein VT85_11650 [Planctomyces sp. SH-PL62]